MQWGNVLRREIGNGLGPAVDLLYPPRCPMCGVAVANHGSLCLDCWGLLEFAGDSGAAAQMEAAATGAPDNGADEPPRETTRPVIAATLYNEASRKLLLAFKHGGKITLAPLMVRMMAGRLPDFGDADGEGAHALLLIPVPLHPMRLWRRGYNQAGLLARELARLGKGEVMLDALVRVKRTPSLGGLDHDERRAALAGAVKARKRCHARIKGRAVILVDDVYTSGATSNACIAALDDAGTKSLSIAYFAKAGRG